MLTHTRNQLKTWSHLEPSSETAQYVVIKEDEDSYYAIPYFTYEWFTRKGWSEHWDLLNYHIFQDCYYQLCERTTTFTYEGYEWLFEFDIAPEDASHARKIGWFFHQFATWNDMSISERLERLLAYGPITLPPTSVLKKMLAFIVDRYDQHKERLFLLLSPTIQRYIAS